jgi:tyrosinase
MLSLVQGPRPKRGACLRLEPLEARTLLSSVAPGAGAAAAPQTGPPTASTYVRKNQSALTDREKSDFIDAIKTLKTTYNPGSTLSIYDEFVQTHYNAFASGQAHEGPAFLAWHREFLLLFEQELQTVNPAVTIPYWDFTVDNSASSSIWDKHFLGGNGDPNDNWIVKDGPFARGQWTLNVDGYDGTDLRRQFGEFVSSLPTAADVANALQADLYDVYPYDSGSPIDHSFRNNIEGFNHPTAEPELHNRVHGWIGGSMAIAYSPNDPVFWMLHADIDRVWAEWEDQNGYVYAPEEGGRQGQNLYDAMTPFGVTPASVLDHWALGYRYDTEPADGGSGGGAAAPLTARPGAGAGAFSGALASAALHGLHGVARVDGGPLTAWAGSVGLLGEHGAHAFGEMTAGGLTGLAQQEGVAGEGPGMVAAVVHAGSGGAERPTQACT